jgi:hypothetical protein
MSDEELKATAIGNADDHRSAAWWLENLAKNPEALAKFRQWLELEKHRETAMEARKVRREKEKIERAKVRESTPATPLTVATLALKMDDMIGIGPTGREEEYFKNYVQPYCKCEAGEYQWELCDHAKDLGFWV